MKVKVILMRRDDLTEEESNSLLSFYPPATEFEIVRRDPVDFREHLTMCLEFQPDVVILPREKPVPILAMEQGFAHISMTPMGFRRLLKVPPDFVDFVPGASLPSLASEAARTNALELAISIMSGECPVVPEVNESEIAALTEILEEHKRRLMLQPNPFRDHNGAMQASDDAYLVEPPAE